jgi:hypothetical protein
VFIRGKREENPDNPVYFLQQLTKKGRANIRRVGNIMKI